MMNFINLVASRRALVSNERNLSMITGLNMSFILLRYSFNSGMSFGTSSTTAKWVENEFGAVGVDGTDIFQ